MEYALLAALSSALAMFIGVGALTGQLAGSHRQLVRRAERVAGRRGSREDLPSSTDDLLRADALSGKSGFARLLRGFDWAQGRARLLERADVPLKVSEWLMVNAAIFAGLALVASLLSQIWFIGLCFGAGGLVIFEAWIRQRVGKRRALFDQQLPTALEIMSTGLKSGFGIMESIRVVAQDMDPPIAAHFRRVLDETRIGGSFEEVMGRMVERVGSADLRIVARALTIHRAVGGDLAEVLDSVGSTMREREALRGHVGALTAQQRMGGLIVGLLPVWVLGFFSVAEPEFISPLWEEPLGRMFLIGGIGLDAAAFFIMQRVLKIEV